MIQEYAMLRSLKLLPLVAALTALGIFTGCGTDHAKVRVVHASPDAPNIDVAVDGKTVVTNLAFGEVSPASDYLTISSENRRVEVRPTGTTTDIINSTAGFSGNKEYTLIAAGFAALPAGGDPAFDIGAVLLTDDNSAPSSGNVKIRVVNAAPLDGTAANGVDVYIVAPATDIATLTPNISNLAYGQASGYQSVPEASNQIIFTDAGNKTPIINQTYTLSAGQIRTLVSTNVQGGVIRSTTPVVLSDLN